MLLKCKPILLGKPPVLCGIKKEAAAEVWERSACVDEALPYMTHLYLEHANSALTNSSLYTEHEKGEKWVMYQLQSSKLSEVFESQPDSVAAAPGIVKPERQAKAVVEPHEYRQFVERCSDPGTPVPMPTKREDAVFSDIHTSVPL